MNTQDSDKDVLFRQEMGTRRGEPEASLASGKQTGENGERLHHCSRQRSQGACWGLSWLQNEGEVCSGGVQRTDSDAASRRSAPTSRQRPLRCWQASPASREVGDATKTLERVR
jgi:hypothetical protein